MPLDKREPEVGAITAISDIMFDKCGHMREHNFARQLKAEVERLQRGAEALANLKANRSPMDTPAAHALKVAKAAKKLGAEITASKNRANMTWAEGWKDAQRRIDEKVNLTPDAFAGEIRQRFFNMDGVERAELIKQLVDGNRGPEMAAIVRAPSMLTGISDAERTKYEEMIVQRHAPVEVEEAQHLEDILSSTLSACRAADMMVERFSNPQELAAIEKSAARADAAGEAFNQSIQ